MTESQPAAARSGPRDTEYVHGFVAVFGRHAIETRLRLPSGLELSDVREVDAPGWKVLAYGSTKRTADLSASGLHSWVKGRPFVLEGGPMALPALDREEDWERLLVGLDGKFTLLAVDSRGNATCATDLLGHGSVFFVEQDQQLYVSTHLGVLLASVERVPAFDRLGLASQLIARGPVTGRTPFAEIRRLGPSQIIAVDSGAAHPVEGAPAWHVRSYANVAAVLGGSMNGSARRPDATPGQYGSLLRSSIAREGVGSTPTVMLSGGKDSRAILMSLYQGGARDVEAVTFGMPDSSDVVESRRLARSLAVSHDLMPYASWRYEDHAARIVGLGGGAAGLQVAHMLAGFAWAGTRSASAWTGYLGDATTGAHLPRRGEITVDSVLRIVLMRRHDTTGTLAARYYGDEIHALEEEVSCRYESLEGLAPHQRVLLLDWTMRQGGYLTHTFDLCASVMELASPFYYRPLMQFMFGLPEVHLRRQALYVAWLRQVEAQLGLAEEPEPAPAQRPRVPSWLAPLSRAVTRSAGNAAADVSAQRDRGADRLGKEDWARRVDQSRAWLAACAARCADDQLRAVAEESLATSSAPQRVPLALMALTPSMAVEPGWLP